jgi:hypothetical protein
VPPSRLIARPAIVLSMPAIVIRVRNSSHTPSTTISPLRVQPTLPVWLITLIGESALGSRQISAAATHAICGRSGRSPAAQIRTFARGPYGERAPKHLLRDR